MTTDRRKQLPEQFQQLTLTPAQFHTFYNAFMGLRFPMDVSEVLDLRYVVNHAVDDFVEPPLTPDHRQFRESLEKAFDSFTVENAHHRERMLKTLTMIRELHVAHSIASRDHEELLREALEDNRLAHQNAVRRGIFFLFTTIASIAGWFALPEAEWLVKLLSVLCSLETWRHFHALPRLEQRAVEVRQLLNDVLRQRVNSLDWKTLIHKLTLVLGFKKIEGVEVFRMDTDHQDNTTTRH